MSGLFPRTISGTAPEAAEAAEKVGKTAEGVFTGKDGKAATYGQAAENAALPWQRMASESFANTWGFDTKDVDFEGMFNAINQSQSPDDYFAAIQPGREKARNDIMTQGINTLGSAGLSRGGTAANAAGQISGQISDAERAQDVQYYTQAQDQMRQVLATISQAVMGMNSLNQNQTNQGQNALAQMLGIAAPGEPMRDQGFLMPILQAGAFMGGSALGKPG